MANAHSASSDEMATVFQSETLDRDPRYHAALDAYVKDSTRLTAVRTQFTDKYPGLPGLTNQVAGDVAALQRARSEALRNAVTVSPAYVADLVEKRKLEAASAGDAARVAALEEQIGAQGRQLQAFNRAAGVLQSLRDDRVALEATIQTLAQRLGSARADAAGAASLGSAVIVDRAQRAEPRFLQPLLEAALLFLGITLGALSLPFVLDGIDPKLRSRRRIEELYGRPVVGTVTR
jgi:hypothetical protein